LSGDIEAPDVELLEVLPELAKVREESEICRVDREEGRNP
jgi:hypothetical protein